MAVAIFAIDSARVLRIYMKSRTVLCQTSLGARLGNCPYLIIASTLIGMALYFDVVITAVTLILIAVICLAAYYFIDWRSWSAASRRAETLRILRERLSSGRDNAVWLIPKQE